MNIILKYGLAYCFVIVIYFMLPIKYIYIYIYIYIYNVDNHLHWGRCCSGDAQNPEVGYCRNCPAQINLNKDFNFTSISFFIYHLYFVV